MLRKILLSTLHVGELRNPAAMTGIESDGKVRPMSAVVSAVI